MGNRSWLAGADGAAVQAGGWQQAVGSAGEQDLVGTRQILRPQRMLPPHNPQRDGELLEIVKADACEGIGGRRGDDRAPLYDGDIGRRGLAHPSVGVAEYSTCAWFERLGHGVGENIMHATATLHLEWPAGVGHLADRNAAKRYAVAVGVGPCGKCQRERVNRHARLAGPPTVLRWQIAWGGKDDHAQIVVAVATCMVMACNRFSRCKDRFQRQPWIDSRARQRITKASRMLVG